MLRLRAGSVHPVTAPPISDGAVLIAGDGRIAAVGPHARVPTPPGAETREFPDGVLVPGLVNCHTHLELTHLAGRVPTPEFAAWIRRIRELKDGTRLPEFRHAAEQGMRDCWAAGVTCVADTGSTGAVMEVLQAHNCMIVAAAGNDSVFRGIDRSPRWGPRIPALYDSVLGVAADTVRPAVPARYSNRGEYLQLVGAAARGGSTSFAGGTTARPASDRSVRSTRASRSSRCGRPGSRRGGRTPRRGSPRRR